jgi:hypothetical protein
MAAAMLDLLMLTIGSMCAAWMSRLLDAACTVMRHLLLDERVYSEAQSKTALVYVMTRIRKDFIFAQRHEVFDGDMYPSGAVLGRSFAAFTCEIPAGANRMQPHLLTLRVLRWRWLPPLVPDGDLIGAMDDGVGKASGTILVLRTGSQEVVSRDWRVSREMACPPGVAAAVRAGASGMADRIVAAATSNVGGGGQARIVIVGPIGAGKSTAVRMAALALNATLVPVFDPSRPGYSVADVFGQLRSGTRVLLCIEEFEGTLGRLAVPLENGMTPVVTAAVQASSSGIAPEVIDKASWNNMIDMLQFIPNAVLVMTSNLSFEELDAIDAIHGGALLREGRVTHRMSMAATSKKNSRRMRCDDAKRS